MSIVGPLTGVLFDNCGGPLKCMGCKRPIPQHPHFGWQCDCGTAQWAQAWPTIGGSVGVTFRPTAAHDGPDWDKEPDTVGELIAREIWNTVEPDSLLWEECQSIGQDIAAKIAEFPRP